MKEIIINYDDCFYRRHGRNNSQLVHQTKALKICKLSMEAD